jgi:hypothetical protein
MATLSLANRSAVMNLIFRDSLAVQFNDKYPALQLFEVESGSNAVCTWPAEFETRTAGGAYAEGADMASGDYDSNTTLQASQSWAFYRKGARLSGTVQAVVSANGGLPMNMNLVESEIKGGVKSLFKDLNTHLYSGNVGASPVQLAGLAAAIDSSTAAPYAGIDGATYTSWKSGEGSIAVASLSIANVRTYLLNPVRNAHGLNPDFVLCDEVFYDKVKVLADSSGEVPFMYMNGQRVILRDIGVQAVMVDGVPFVYDRFCTTNTAYAITREHIKIVQLPPVTGLYTGDEAVAASNANVIANMVAGMEANSLMVNEAEIMQALLAMSRRIQPVMEPLAKTGDADNYMVKWYGQIKVVRRDTHAKLILT